MSRDQEKDIFGRIFDEMIIYMIVSGARCHIYEHPSNSLVRIYLVIVVYIVCYITRILTYMKTDI